MERGKHIFFHLEGKGGGEMGEEGNSSLLRTFFFPSLLMQPSHSLVSR